MLFDPSKVRPMRGVKPKALPLRYPLLASLKLDGLRALVMEGVVYSKTMKPIPNQFVQKLFGHMHGFDGELIVGAASIQHEDDNVFMRSTGHLRRKSEDFIDVYYHVFDRWDLPETPHIERIKELTYLYEEYTHNPSSTRCKLLSYSWVKDDAELKSITDWALTNGFEGLILRDPNAPYKYGQATEKEGWLLKVKPIEDSEAVVLDILEAFKNDNEAKVKEDGYARRSSTKANRTQGKGIAGSAMLRDIKTGVEFSATFKGFTHSELAMLLSDKADYINKIARYEYQKYGTKDKPRQAKVNGFREEFDLAK